MNDDLQKALAVILAKTTSAIDTGVTFLSDQLPDVIRQLLIWHAVYSALMFFSAVLLGIGAAVAARKFFKAGRAESERHGFTDETGYYCGMVVSGVIALIFGRVAMGHLTWLKIILAPKLYLIEYAASLVTK